VHAVGEVTEHAAIGRLLRRLTKGRLQWTSLGPVYDEFHFPDGFRIDFPDRREQFVDNLLAAFPDEQKAIFRYIDLVKEVGRAMRGYYMARALPPRLAGAGAAIFARKAQRFLSLRTSEVLDGLTGNARLKTVLAAQWGYYGSPPSRSSFAVHALVAKHFWYGGYYPVGGAKRIADTLMQTVAEAGGWTRISSTVDEVLTKNGTAIGVRLDDGEEILAKRIISAAGALNTLRRLLPKEGWRPDETPLAPSPAHLCLNIGFRGDIRAAGASAANKWFYETWDSEDAAWAIDRQQAEAPVLYTSFPSLKDPTYDAKSEAIHTGEAVTFVPYSVFQPFADTRWMRRGERYEALKTELSERLTAQLLRHMPGLEPHLAYAELSTPLSTEHFTRATEGAIYGIEPTPARFASAWLQPRTPLKKFFLAGSDMATVGVIGAFVGGVLAVTAAEPVAAVRYLLKQERRS
jgi:all-trans-retinol 13,14-reductase